MPFSSLPLACILSPSPRTKLSLLSTSTPRLACKLVDTSHIPFNKTFRMYAIPPSTTNNVITPSQEPEEEITNDGEWEAERETLLHQIQDLVLRIQRLSSASGANKRSLLVDILKDFYSLGTKMIGLEPKGSMPTPSIITQTLMDLIGKLQVVSTSDDGLVQIDPNPIPGQVSNEIDEFVETVAKAYWSEKDPPYYLTGNFAPVRQENPPTTDLLITGQIPESLNGMMLRNGPDPKFDPEANYSWMDGDSMVHGIRFKDGKATYVSRYVDSSRFIHEGEFNRAEIFRYGDLEGEYGRFALFIQLLRAKLRILDMSYGYTMANTGLVYHGGRIMALCDFGKPHVISVADNGDIKTIGINDYNGVLTHSFTPHPKIDPITGEMFVFGSMHTDPYCIYNVISKDGVMRAPVPITVGGPTYMHDMGLTNKYVIFMDLPYVFSTEEMVDKNEWVFNLDFSKRSRFGILPRYATSEEEMKWFEFDSAFFIFHNGNAWEDEDGNIVMYSCLMNPSYYPNTNNPYFAPIISRRGTKSEVLFTLPQMYKLTFNMTTMEAKRELITDTYVDSPKINESYRGRPSRYVYTVEVDQFSKLPSLIKFDMNVRGGKIETPLTFEQGVYASGEAVFVPKPDKVSANPTSEDDGYLIVFVHDENIDKSFVYVIDAQTMKIISTIQLPNRVPYGFHAIFCTEDELKAQKTI